MINIESMAFKGYGVARVNGKVVFIPHSVTGDEVWIEIVEEKKDYSMGRLKKILTPSPWRVNPPCPFFGQCGGCQWQHINDSIQINLKKEILKDVLKRLGGLKETPPIMALPSPQPYGYRARIQLKARGDAMGYYQERSHRIVNIDHCPIAHPLVNQIIFFLQGTSLSSLQTEEIEINVSPEEGKGVIVLHHHASYQEIERFGKELLRAHPILKGIAFRKGRSLILLGNPYLNFMIPSNRWKGEKFLWLRTSPESFFQVNHEQNQALIRKVLEFSDLKGEERVLDLYAGVGNFTLPLATASKEIYGIEENRAAVEDARFNTEKNGINNSKFIHGKVEDILNHWEKKRPALMILDPPRAGCKAALPQLVRLKPTRIVYTSCEPTTFSRDLRIFSGFGYYLQKLGLIDMFPQTYHMEAVGLLQRG